MKVLKSWLQDFVDINISDQELADKLSLSGTSVDEIHGGLDDKIIIAQIKEIKPHPNADRLQVVTVFDGQNDLQIVCGAPNIAVGQIVPLAIVGAKISDIKIEEAEIRGVKSFGMMCSDRELGLSETHDGIKILSDNFVIGKPLNEHLKNDTVFDLEITANRGDSLSHLGVAREISAVTHEPMKINDIKTVSTDQGIAVEVEDNNLCPQYLAQTIIDVKVTESPNWLKDRLIALGQKPINNIVDITNYILFDLGQPMHALDRAKIKDKIVVRQAVDGESLMSLDGIERKLKTSDLVIADNEKVIAVAGVIGGANSQVDESTTSIILEAAEFNQASVRKTAKSLNLTTEASYRFERGIDSGQVESALNKAAKMIIEIAGGRAEGQTKIGKTPDKVKINLDHNQINELLGTNIDDTEINQILESLGFEIASDQVIVPLWRHDVAIWQDLAEEVGRVYGYDKIKPVELEKITQPELSEYFQKEVLKNILVEMGFSEVQNYVFLSSRDLEIAQIESRDLLEVANPLQPENKFLRNSLVPHLLKNVAKNPTFDPIALFEIGSVFTKENETVYLGLVTSGKDAKKIIDGANQELGNILSIKELSRDELSRFKIRKPVTYVAEIDIATILPKIDLQEKNLPLQAALSDFSYRAVSKYPPVVRDLAFIVDGNVESNEIEQAIINLSPIILMVEVFDEFASEKFGANKKNIAYHVYLQNMTRAMDDEEAETIIDSIVKEITTKYQAKLRS